MAMFSRIAGIQLNAPTKVATCVALRDYEIILRLTAYAADSLSLE